jgi:hypothetical protein
MCTQREEANCGGGGGGGTQPEQKGIGEAQEEKEGLGGVSWWRISASSRGMMSFNMTPEIVGSFYKFLAVQHCAVGALSSIPSISDIGCCL